MQEKKPFFFTRHHKSENEVRVATTHVPNVAAQILWRSDEVTRPPISHFVGVQHLH